MARADTQDMHSDIPILPDPSDSGAIHSLERYHWINTLTGSLHETWRLNEHEQLSITSMIERLLIALNIPERGNARRIGMPLLLEYQHGHYGEVLHSSNQLARTARQLTNSAATYSISVWREDLRLLFTQAYPDLEPEEVLLIDSTFNDILRSLQISKRAPSHLPISVMRTAERQSHLDPDIR